MTRSTVTTAAVLLGCWPAWEAAGWLVGMLGLPMLDLPLRGAALALYLWALEAFGL